MKLRTLTLLAATAAALGFSNFTARAADDGSTLAAKQDPQPEPTPEPTPDPAPEQTPDPQDPQTPPNQEGEGSEGGGSEGGTPEGGEGEQPADQDPAENEPANELPGGPANKSPEATGDPALDELVVQIRESELDAENAKWRLLVKEPKEVEFSEDKNYLWTLNTNKGSLVIRLLPEAAPKHVASTAYLTMLDFYDGLTFHRVIDGFMAQGGCPLGTGSGGPAYNYDAELVNGVNHSGRGALSMANAGQGTDGSQFFITFQSRPDLDRLNQHTVFGRVISGWRTLDAIEALADPTAANGVPPLEPIIIESATIEAVAK